MLHSKVKKQTVSIKKLLKIKYSMINDGYFNLLWKINDELNTKKRKDCG